MFHHVLALWKLLLYHLHRTDLNAAFLDGIRASIDAERIKVVIEAEEQFVHSPTAEQSLQKMIEENRRKEHEYNISSEDFAAMVAAFD